MIVLKARFVSSQTLIDLCEGRCPSGAIMENGQLNVTTLDHVWSLEIRTDGVWWLVGVFATTDNAREYLAKEFPDVSTVDSRINRRVVR